LISPTAFHVSSFPTGLGASRFIALSIVLPKRESQCIVKTLIAEEAAVGADEHNAQQNPLHETIPARAPHVVASARWTGTTRGSIAESHGNSLLLLDLGYNRSLQA